MEYAALDHTHIDTLLEAWNLAFSDYSVPMHLSTQALESLLLARGYCASASVGAFSKGRLVGFVLNALRPVGDILAAYDTGTGVVPGFRGRGVGSAMLGHALPLLRSAGAGQYLLEVIQTNTPAVELYTRKGFVTLRRLMCYRGPMPAPAESRRWHIQYLDLPAQALWPQLEALWDVTPSWQNSLLSVAARPEGQRCAVVMDGEALLGYGILDTARGSLVQLAVHPHVRRRGLGRALLDTLARASAAKQLTAVNVDAACPATMAFLEACGLSLFTSQYEMALPLS